MSTEEIEKNLFIVQSENSFRELALATFRIQAQQNSIYKNYLEAIKIAWQSVENIENIPFLPIEFFKTHQVKTGEFDPEVTFTSSGTTGSTQSKHLVKSSALYHRTFMDIFQRFYGDPRQYIISALLPSYLERNGSSLIEMTSALIAASGHRESGFYLRDHEQLADLLSAKRNDGRKHFLIGVTFGLLDFAENYKLHLPDAIVMETGGMKGRRQEMIREEVSAILCDAFRTQYIHSEYGMTELMSQAYAKKSGLFMAPPWMRILIRDTSDPLNTKQHGSGALNIIDLANIHSCSFIATQDLGKVHPDGHFEVTGRMDQSDVRGCNLMVI